MSGRAQITRTLPITLEPKKDELLGSFIERVATLNEISSYEMLRHFLDDEASKVSAFSILFFDENGKAKIERLAKALHAEIETIQSIAIPKKFLRYDKNDFSLQSACKDIKLGRSVYDPVLRPSWCPQCLLEDVLGCIGQYLRCE